MTPLRCVAPMVLDAELPWTAFAEHYMGMPAQREKRIWTEAEFHAARDAAPPGERWELVDGEVMVTPSPTWVHQDAVGLLYLLIRAYVDVQGIGRTFFSPLDVKLRRGLVLQPDLLVVPNGELRRCSDVVQHLVLAVEVLSPGSARHDRVTKRPQYQRHRVPEYWIVDGWSRTVERWHPSDDRPEIVSEILTWHPEGAAQPFTLPLAEYFEQVSPEGE